MKLEMREHKAMLSVILIVSLVLGLLFGTFLSSLDVLPIVTFALVFLLFTLSLITVSMLFRTRDELHALHEERRRESISLHAQMRAPAVKTGTNRRR